MKKHIKIFLIFSFLILAFMLGATFYEYKKNNDIKHLISQEEATALTEFIKSFQKIYMENIIHHDIEINNKTIHLLPVKTTPQISKDFASLLKGKISIRTVSDRPRNPSNQANKFEQSIIEYFKKNKKSETFVSHESEFVHSYFVPFYITQSCLKCHGKKENAVKAIRDNYDNAYDYKLGEVRGVLHLKISDEDTFLQLDKTFYEGIIIKLIIAIIVIFLLYYLINLIRKSEQTYTKKLERKVAVQIAELRKKDQILNNQSKMASMGEMLENIAHQWRQPLSVISTAASGIKIRKEFDQISDKELLESLEGITQSAKYLSHTIDDFRDFFKSDKTKESFSVKEAFSKTVVILESKFKNKDIEIISDIDDLNVYGVENELIQVFMNLLNNAQDALIESQNTRKIILVSIKQKKDEVVILIKDNANGISKNIIKKIFEPYFTTKHKSQGTGIGLYMTQEIISKHFKGTVFVKNCQYSFENEEYTGALFTIHLPVE